VLFVYGAGIRRHLYSLLSFPRRRESSGFQFP
jgi:hypothetical protein